MGGELHLWSAAIAIAGALLAAPFLLIALILGARGATPLLHPRLWVLALSPALALLMPWLLTPFMGQGVGGFYAMAVTASWLVVLGAGAAAAILVVSRSPPPKGAVISLGLAGLAPGLVYAALSFLMIGGGGV